MAEISHVKRAHSLLSPSGSARWIGCPPSLRLEEESGIKDTTSEFALEGTLAHEMAELILSRDLERHDPEDLLWIEHSLEELAMSPFYYDGMEEDVREYTGLCLDRHDLAVSEASKGFKPRVSIETKVPLAFLVPADDELRKEIKDDHGTVDFSIVGEDHLTVIDLKFGRGVKVSAKGNPQLRIYAWGLYLTLTPAERKRIKEIRMIIAQTRVPGGISEEVLTVNYLRAWVEGVAIPAAVQALAGEGEQKVGDWCAFCKVKPVCRAQKEHALEAVKDYFPDKLPELLDDDEVVEMYQKSSLIIGYLNSISGYMLTRALSGHKYPGYKVVQGRSVRRWVNAEQAALHLEMEGYDEKDIYNTTIKGIGAIEKLVGKKNFETVMAGHVIKPEGAPTLAPEGDKREEYVPGDKADHYFEDLGE